MPSLEYKLTEIFKAQKGKTFSRELLVSLTGENDRTIRAAIASLRGRCIPIISLDKGYRWAKGEELIDYIKR